jgi:hypothetical protein
MSLTTLPCEYSGTVIGSRRNQALEEGQRSGLPRYDCKHQRQLGKLRRQTPPAVIAALHERQDAPGQLGILSDLHNLQARRDERVNNFV